MIGYTPRQIADAKKACELYHGVGVPNVEKFKLMLQMKQIFNCPVTVKDIDQAKIIFGEDMSTLKGKSTRRKPPRIMNNIFQVPKEIYFKNGEVEPCINSMWVNNWGYLTSIDRMYQYRNAVHLESKHDESHYTALNKILCLYNQSGIQISVIHADPEYKSMMDDVKVGLDIAMNYVLA